MATTIHVNYSEEEFCKWLSTCIDEAQGAPRLLTRYGGINFRDRFHAACFFATEKVSGTMFMGVPLEVMRDIRGGNTSKYVTRCGISAAEE